jgi:hypothetical protein
MADFDDVRQAIETELANQKKKVLNRNAYNALFGALGGALSGDATGVLDGLKKIFFGRSEALENEKQKIAQQAILELVCRIDEALTQANMTASAAGGVTVSGLVETIASSGDIVIGAHIDNSAGPVIFEPGTRIRTETQNVRHTVGLNIGGSTHQ